MKKGLGIGLAVLMVLGLSGMAIASDGHVFIIGTGEYNETRAFGEISDRVKLTGTWNFESTWTHPGSPGTIANNVVLFGAPSTFYEHTVSPKGTYLNTGHVDYDPTGGVSGLDLLTTVRVPGQSILDYADVQVKGYDFTFDAATGSYDSTKHLQIFDSHNYYTSGSTGTGNVKDESVNRDTAQFQANDMSDSVYLVGGQIEYIKPFASATLVAEKVNLHQEFSKNSPPTSYVTSNFCAIGHVVSTAYYGYDAAGDGLSDSDAGDWYGDATMDIKGNNKHDTLYAAFVGPDADFALRWSSCATNYDSGVQKGKNHPMELYAYSDTDFDASGNARDVGSAGWPLASGGPFGWPLGSGEKSGAYEAPSGQWTFTGTSFYKLDNDAVNWLAGYDMEP